MTIKDQPGDASQLDRKSHIVNRKFMDMSEYAEPSPTELEQIVDEARRDCGLGPAPRAAGTGIADMDARIEYFTRLLAKLKDQTATPAIAHLITETERDLREARGRRYEYLVQQKNLN